MSRLDGSVLRIDLTAEVQRITAWVRQVLANPLRRRGLVVALSGGIDSSVCAALAVRAVGPQRVFGLLMPERDSSGDSEALGALVARHLGIAWQREHIGEALGALGCYRMRDDAIRRVFPAYGEGWRSKIVISGGIEGGGINYFRLVVRGPDGPEQSQRLRLAEYLEIVAATNLKQRLRKTLEYTHADRLNYAVVGTPNRLEYDQGFFVKNGDGSADLKPVAHLYKTQVFAMAAHLGLPEAICNAVPTTDTYSLPQGQDEFFFALPYAQMDLALYARDHEMPAADLAVALGIDSARAQAIYADIDAKRRVAEYLRAPPALV